MCGIAGILLFQEKDNLYPRVKKMCKMLAHRGPDDEGIICFDTYKGREEEVSNLALGHRRLSIIDLSEKGHQPMANEDGTVWLSYNGEIYNYLELRGELEGKGHVFRSHCDAEVVIHAYEEYGCDCQCMFNGMWSFVIYDKKQGLLFCSRDRFGEKPFYYYYDNKRFIFASEIKALFAEDIKRAPYNDLLVYYFNSGKMDNGEDTFFEGIKQLLPAHYMIVKDGKIARKRYWDYDKSLSLKYNYNDPISTFRDLFIDSVRLRLRSDVPVGTSLSGGIDSTSIVGVMKKCFNIDVRTFSSIYQQKDCDESYYIDIVNRQYDCKSEKVYPKPGDFPGLMESIVWHQDEPVFAPGVYSQWHVMDISSHNVKVLLDGQGADELLGGYWGYFYYYLISGFQRASKRMNPVLLARYAIDIIRIYNLTRQDYVLSSIYQRFKKSVSSLGQEGVFSDSFISGTRKIQRIRDNRGDNPLDNVLYWHLMADNIPALLHFEDRNSMAHSIEARIPFLDHRLAEFCLGLDFMYKINGPTTKFILRKALHDIIPRQVAARRDKKGYPTPVASWFNGELKEYVRDIVLSQTALSRKIFDRSRVESVITEHAKGRKDLSWLIWKILIVEIWMRTFIDGNYGKEQNTDSYRRQAAVH